MRLADPLPKAVTERSRIFERAREEAWDKEQEIVYTERLATGVDPALEEKTWELDQQRAFAEWQLYTKELALDDVETGEDEGLVAELAERQLSYSNQRGTDVSAAGEERHVRVERGAGAGAKKRMGAKGRARTKRRARARSCAGKERRAREELDKSEGAREAVGLVAVTKLQAAVRKPPKTFVKALGLVMDRPPKAKSGASRRIRFLSPNAQELYTATERAIVNKRGKQTSKEFWEMLGEDDTFLLKEVDDILQHPEVGHRGGYFGQDIWSEKYDFLLIEPSAPDEPDVPKTKLRWDEHEQFIRWNVRCWIVSRIWEKITKREAEEGVEKWEQAASAPGHVQEHLIHMEGTSNPSSNPSTSKEDCESASGAQLTLPSSIDVDDFDVKRDEKAHLAHERLAIVHLPEFSRLHRRSANESCREGVQMILRDNLTAILDQQSCYQYIKPLVYEPALHITRTVNCGCNSAEHDCYDCLKTTTDITAWIAIIERVETFLNRTGYRTWTPGRHWQHWVDHVERRTVAERFHDNDELRKLRKWGEEHNLHIAAEERQWATGLAAYIDALLGENYGIYDEFSTLVDCLYIYNRNLLDWFRERSAKE